MKRRSGELCVRQSGYSAPREENSRSNTVDCLLCKTIPARIYDLNERDTTGLDRLTSLGCTGVLDKIRFPRDPTPNSSSA